MSDDLKRDLKLATTQAPIVQIAIDELAPKAQKEVALKLKKAPGPKVIRSSRPTVKASPKPTEVAEVKTEIPQVQVMASSTSEAADPAPSAPPVARPAPIPLPTSAGGSTGTDNGAGAGNAGSGIGAVLGGIFGAVLRGGVVAGDDHCDPRTDGRRRPGGVYGRPNGGTIIGGMGGVTGRQIPGTRFPVNPITGRH